MTILAGDVKLVASQVMDDVDEGGGAPTAVVIEEPKPEEVSDMAQTVSAAPKTAEKAE